jgi:hypothetical protein
LCVPGPVIAKHNSNRKGDTSVSGQGQTRHRTSYSPSSQQPHCCHYRLGVRDHLVNRTANHPPWDRSCWTPGEGFPVVSGAVAVCNHAASHTAGWTSARGISGESSAFARRSASGHSSPAWHTNRTSTADRVAVGSGRCCGDRPRYSTGTPASLPTAGMLDQAQNDMLKDTASLP